MAKKNIASATKVASMLDNDSLMIEAGGSLRRLPLNNFRESLNQNDEQILREVAFYIDINEPSSKGSTRVDVGGNMGMRELWENAKKSILMDKDGNYCELNPNDCRYTADGEYVLKDDGSVIDKYAHCDFMVLIPEYYGRVQEVKVSDTKTIQRCWFSLIPLVGGYTIPQQVVGKFKAVILNNALRSMPNCVPSRSKTVNEFWDIAQARSKNHGLVNLDFRNYMLFYIMSKYGWRDVQNAVGADGTKVFGVGLDGSESTGSNKDYIQNEIKAGSTLILGNNDGNVAVIDRNGDTVHSVNVCGFENPYGQFWELVQGLCSVGTDVYYWRGNVMPTGTLTTETFANIDHTLLMRPTTAVWGMNIIVSGDGQGVYMIPNKDVSGISYGDVYTYEKDGQLWMFSGIPSYGSNCGLATVASGSKYDLRSSAAGTRLAFYGSVKKVSPQQLATTA